MARRAVIEREELFREADDMAAEGKPVTALALLDALGGGSYRTIYKYLKEWEESRPSDKPVIESGEIPESVQKTVLNTWRVATMEAAKEVTAAKEKAAEEVNAAQAKFEEALEAIQKLEDEGAKDAKQIDELKTKIAELEQAVSQLSSESAAAKATAEQLQNQVKAQQVELDRAHKAQEADRQQHKELLEKLEREHANAQDKTTKQIEQLQAALLDGQKKIEQSERDRLETVIKLEKAEEKAQSDRQSREQADKERDAAIKDAAQLKGQIEVLNAQNAQYLVAFASNKGKGKAD